jgi:hypothetical protein
VRQPAVGGRLGGDALTPENPAQHIKACRIPGLRRVGGVWVLPPGPLLRRLRNGEHQAVEEKHLAHECIGNAVVHDGEGAPQLAAHTPYSAIKPVPRAGTPGRH